VSTEVAGSSVALENGYVQLVNAGTIVRDVDFSSPVKIISRFQLSNNERSNLKYVLRSDGTKYFSERKGVAVQLSCRTDWNGYVNQLAIFELGNTSLETPGPVISNSVEFTTPLNLNTWYNLQIIDYSDRIEVFFADSLTPITLSTTYSVGSKLSIYNRHGAADGSSISEGGTARLDFISIVPEPSSLSLLLAGGAVLMAGRRRSRG